MSETKNEKLTQKQHKTILISKLKQMSLFRIIWYATFFVASIFCLVFIKPFYFSLVISVVSLWLYLLAMNLTAQGSILGIVFNIFSSLLYVTICFFTQVYGEVIINLSLYVPLNIHALFTFKKRSEKTNELAIRKLRIKHFLFSILILLFLFAIFSVGLWFIPNQNLPIFNALLISSTIMFMLLRNGRFVETWFFNFLSCSTSIVMWIVVACNSKDALFSLPSGALAGLSALINSIYGFITWKKIFDANKTVFVIFKKRNNFQQTKNLTKKQKNLFSTLSWTNQIAK